MKHVEFYRNDKDGSVLVSVGTQVPEKLIYAGQELTHLVADTVDAAKEKHVPAIQKIDGHLEVHVGSVTHPMEEKHYIEWMPLSMTTASTSVTSNQVKNRRLNLKQAMPAKSMHTATSTACGRSRSLSKKRRPSTGPPARRNLAAALSTNYKP